MPVMFCANPASCICEINYLLSLTQPTSRGLLPQMPAESLGVLKTGHKSAVLFFTTLIFPINPCHLYLVPAINFAGCSAVNGDIYSLSGLSWQSGICLCLKKPSSKPACCFIAAEPTWWTSRSMVLSDTFCPVSASTFRDVCSKLSSTATIQQIFVKAGLICWQKLIHWQGHTEMNSLCNLDIDNKHAWSLSIQKQYYIYLGRCWINFIQPPHLRAI